MLYVNMQAKRRCLIMEEELILDDVEMINNLINQIILDTSGNTGTDIVIYTRYSTSKQNDTSIEGQLQEIWRFCKSNNYRVVDVYIDRAKSRNKR